MSYLTTSICQSTKKDFIKAIEKAGKTVADAIELRFDYISDLDVDDVRKMVQIALDTDLKIIATCRDEAEDGKNNYDAEFRLTVLQEAVKAGVHFIDCEFANYTADFRKPIDKILKGKKTRLILSSHDFKGPFDNLSRKYDVMQSVCNDAIIKIAYKANHINDCFECFDVLHKRKGDAIILAMGEAGVITRLLAPKIGSFLSFGTTGETKTAPGQISIKEMKKLYRFKAITPQTWLYGIIASPVAHSMSPAIYNKSFKKTGKNKLFVPLNIEGGKPEFDLFMENVASRPWLDFRGFAVSLPHKVNAFEYAKANGEVTGKATKVGAVNTLKIRSIIGHNTDYAGAINPLLDICNGKVDVKVAVIGAGGVARAVVAALSDNGADVVLFNRTLAKAKKLATEFHCRSCGVDKFPACENFQIIINCTSLGMSPDIDLCPIDPELIEEGTVVFDTVYNPLETKLLRLAETKGAIGVSGLEMFVHQAIEQYEFLIGEEIEGKFIRKVVLKKIESE